MDCFPCPLKVGLTGTTILIECAIWRGLPVFFRFSSGCGGTGRRARFRSLFSLESGGSSPFTRTNLKLIFLIYCKIALYDDEHFMDEISYGNNGNQERRIEAGI